MMCQAVYPPSIMYLACDIFAFAYLNGPYVIPSQLTGLSNLQYFRMKIGKLTGSMHALSQLTCLSELSLDLLDYLPQVDLVRIIAPMKHLRTLHILRKTCSSGLNLRALTGLTRLSSLYLDSIPISNGCPFPSQLSELVSLTLIANKLTAMPAGLSAFKKLKLLEVICQRRMFDTGPLCVLPTLPALEKVTIHACSVHSLFWLAQAEQLMNVSHPDILFEYGI